MYVYYIGATGSFLHLPIYYLYLAITIQETLNLTKNAEQHHVLDLL